MGAIWVLPKTHLSNIDRHEMSLFYDKRLHVCHSQLPLCLDADLFGVEMRNENLF